MEKIINNFNTIINNILPIMYIDSRDLILDETMKFLETI